MSDKKNKKGIFLRLSKYVLQQWPLFLLALALLLLCAALLFACAMPARAARALPRGLHAR